MTDTRAVIDRLAADFEPVNDTSFRLFGTLRLAATLAEVLYTEVHCGLPASATARGRRGSHFASPRAFRAMLSGANSGTGSWQPGWRVTRVADEAIVAVSMGAAFRVPAGEWRSTAAPARDHAVAVREGDSVSVHVPNEYRHLLPGFYMATGDADDDMDGAPGVRVYWHVSARGAVELMGALTTGLNERRVAFRLKTNADPRDYGRTDSMVLYLRRDRYTAAAATLADVARVMQGQLDPRVSPFAKCMAPGVGLAEDPGEGSSFGQHRSRLMAEALASAAAMDARSVTDRARVVSERVVAVGLDPRALYLGAGSADIYPAFDA